MKALTYVRLLTYSLLLIIAMLLQLNDQVRVIPVSLISEGDLERVDINRQRVFTEDELINQEGFASTMRSGSEVFRIARDQLRQSGQNPHGFETYVALRYVKKRVTWIVTFSLPGTPFTYRVMIDDQSGAATFEDATAPV